MYVNSLGLCVGGVALVPAVVGGPSLLDEQEAHGSLPFLGDHADATTRRVVADNLRKQS